MTTATIDREITQDATQVDISTRLMLADVAMDVSLTRAATSVDAALSRHSCVQEAHQAATDAIAEAGRYADQCRSLAAPVRSVSSGILSAAADLIRARGWKQGDWSGDNCEVCLLRAIHLAAGGSNNASTDAVNLLRARIFEQTGERVHSVPFWNDRRGRTVGEILAVLG